MENLTMAINGMELTTLTGEIRRTMRRSARDAVQLGYMLRRVMEEKLWEGSYSDFDEYLRTELQMDYTLANRLIGINKRFSMLGKSMEIAAKYEQYSQGLLIEMLNMTPEQEAKVSPKMTVKQAREIKKQDRAPKQETVLPVPEEVIIDGEFREIKEPEKVATSQPEESVSPYGCKKSEYPSGSLIASKGCGQIHDCFSCAQRCAIRQEERWCVEAPCGAPFSCTTMSVLENLKDEFEDECQFVNQDLASKRAGDGEDSPCCKHCHVYDCGYRCSRAAKLAQERSDTKFCGQKDPCQENEEPENDLVRLKRLLDRKKQELEECVKVDAVERLPEEYMYEKKIVVGAIANMLCELEGLQDSEPELTQEQHPQPDLPVLKNNEQRQQWLNGYRSWGLWYWDENIDVNYYKYDFSDGSRLVVAEYPQRRCSWRNDKEDQAYYHLLEKNCKGYKGTYDKQFVHSTDSTTYLVEFLKSLQKGERG